MSNLHRKSFGFSVFFPSNDEVHRNDRAPGHDPGDRIDEHHLVEGCKALQHDSNKGNPQAAASE